MGMKGYRTVSTVKYFMGFIWKSNCRVLAFLKCYIRNKKVIFHFRPAKLAFAKSSDLSTGRSSKLSTFPSSRPPRTRASTSTRPSSPWLSWWTGPEAVLGSWRSTRPRTSCESRWTSRPRTTWGSSARTSQTTGSSGARRSRSCARSQVRILTLKNPNQFGS